MTVYEKIIEILRKTYGNVEISAGEPLAKIWSSKKDDNYIIVHVNDQLSTFVTFTEKKLYGLAQDQEKAKKISDF